MSSALSQAAQLCTILALLPPGHRSCFLHSYRKVPKRALSGVILSHELAHGQACDKPACTVLVKSTLCISLDAHQSRYQACRSSVHCFMCPASHFLRAAGGLLGRKPLRQRAGKSGWLPIDIICCYLSRGNLVTSSFMFPRSLPECKLLASTSSDPSTRPQELVCHCAHSSLQKEVTHFVQFSAPARYIWLGQVPQADFTA
eukprot:1156198-Pelagomonas_calceolata.AAC.6